MTNTLADEHGPAGALPVPWPSVPDAQFVVPFPGNCEFDRVFQRDLERINPPLSPALVVTRDTFSFGGARMGILVESRQWAPLIRMSLAVLTLVQAGEISGLRKPLRWRVSPDNLSEFVKYVTLTNGPALWLRSPKFDWVISVTDPCRLAGEIERRRWRTVHCGSPETARLWKRVPSIRVPGPDGFQPPVPADDLAAPSLVTKHHGTWTPLRTAPFDRVPPAPAATASPEPLTAVPYPETLGDVVLPISEGRPPLVLNISNHRIRLSQQPLPAAENPFLDPDLDESQEPVVLSRGPRPYLSAPTAEFPVIRAGTLSGVPDGWSIRILAPDVQTEIRIDIVDGPAVWLWGMTTEWLLCTPYAEQVAADLRLRRRVASLYPLIGDYSAETGVWLFYPDMELVETEQGWCLPPTPPYAPSEPTIVPPGTWRAGPN